MKRETWDIYADILAAIDQHQKKNGVALLTRVQCSSFIPYDRFKMKVDKLRLAGLVEASECAERRGTSLTLTEKGRAFLRLWKQIASLFAPDTGTRRH